MQMNSAVTAFNIFMNRLGNLSKRGRARQGRKAIKLFCYHLGLSKLAHICFGFAEFLFNFYIFLFSQKFSFLQRLEIRFEEKKWITFWRFISQQDGTNISFRYSRAPFVVCNSVVLFCRRYRRLRLFFTRVSSWVVQNLVWFRTALYGSFRLLFPNLETFLRRMKNQMLNHR